MTDLHASIKQGWADYFQCNVTDIEKPGTTIVVNESQQGSNRLDIWHIEQHSFLRLEPQLETWVRDRLDDQLDNTCFTAQMLLHKWQADGAAHDYTVDICYLYPHKFQSVEPASPFHCRQMNLADKGYLDHLKASCTADELEEADIDIDNDVIFGCFQGDQLVSVASMYTVWDSFADVGVLTHPNFRGQRLGAAVTSAISRYLLAQKTHIILYRYSVENVGSAGVARSVGFSKYYQQVGVKLV